jgi:fructose-1,6-bisphosphatase/inositol monophosphatase family enzyme
MIKLTSEEAESARVLLCQLGDHIRDAILHARTVPSATTFAHVSRQSLADTIYEVDRISEEAIGAWFESHWPRHWPVELVMEGLEGGEEATFPRGTPLEETEFKCIIDPIDGTRGLMYDKRSAWALAALAPQKGHLTRLSDLFVAAMTELPVTKQWRADQISAARGAGIVAEFIDVFDQSRHPLKLQPSRATNFKHGFASFVKFFPEGKALTAQLEERLWKELYSPSDPPSSPVIFDDQYIATGGQFYELLAGHDRMIADLRPLILPAVGIAHSLVCHPYDFCTALVLEEAGIILESPTGGPVDAPLDTTSPVAWVGFANGQLAGEARPVLHRLLRGLTENAF